MEWQDRAIIINKTIYNDDSSILYVLTKNSGLKRGLIKNTKKHKSIVYEGNIADITWKARLEHHLGNFQINSYESIAPFLYHDHLKLTALLSICSMVKLCLTEQEPQAKLYASLENLLLEIKYSEPWWLTSLIQFELDLLSRSGFGLDLTKCAASEETEDLCYISPKTGKAVSRKYGYDYDDKLFKFPECFTQVREEFAHTDILYALNVTKYFFNKSIVALRNTALPDARTKLEEVLQKLSTLVE